MKKTRTEITKEDAQRVVWSQEESTLVDYCFESALFNEFDQETGLEEIPFHKINIDEMKNLLLEKTEFALVEAEGKVYLDWKNSISGFGSKHWGHEPIELSVSDNHQLFITRLIQEGYTDDISDETLNI